MNTWKSYDGHLMFALTLKGQLQLQVNVNYPSKSDDTDLRMLASPFLGDDQDVADLIVYLLAEFFPDLELRRKEGSEIFNTKEFAKARETRPCTRGE